MRGASNSTSYMESSFPSLGKNVHYVQIKEELPLGERGKFCGIRRCNWNQGVENQVN